MARSLDTIGFTARYSSTDGKGVVVIEDDGRVGYAYLLDSDGGICGDVWLYNRCPAPSEPEWSDREKAPFANPAAYVVPGGDLSLPASADDISVEWGLKRGATEARIFVHGQLAARLICGAKPGWSTLAGKDGPLAKVLKE